MSVPVVYRPQALIEAEEIRAAYETKLIGLGDRFVTALQHSVEAIQSNPRVYGVARRGVRAAPIRKFPHLIYYMDYNSYVLVLAVQHGRRSTRNWRDRL